MDSVPAKLKNQRAASDQPKRRTSVHRTHHARDEAVDPVALLDLRHECRDPALVVGGSAEVGEDELLEGVDVVLEVHEV